MYLYFRYAIFGQEWMLCLRDGGRGAPEQNLALHLVLLAL